MLRIFTALKRAMIGAKIPGAGRKAEFSRHVFLNLSVAASIESERLPAKVDVVTALHACNTATDDAIHFALIKQAKFIVLVPCCQAEVAAVLTKNKGSALAKNALIELWRHPLHTRDLAAGHERAALPPARGAWLPGQRHRIGGVGAFDEKRAHHRPL